MEEKSVNMTLQDHERRIGQLENSYEVLRANQAQLEVTVMKEGRDTRDLLTKFVDHALGIKTKKLDYRHTEKMKLFAIISGAVGAGGILTLTIYYLFQYLGG